MSKVEHASGKMLVQYRGKLMSLMPFNDSVDLASDDMKPLLVFTDRDTAVGIVVDQIIDIQEEYIDIQQGTSSEGILGSCIINGQATEVIDVGYYLKKMNADFFKNHGDEDFNSTHGKSDSSRRKVLLIDDSPFFRNMLTPLLSVAGYEVTSLESPIKALELSERGQKFDLIISDIEMPDMNGFEFAARIRSGGEWQKTPLVALSSHATQKDIDHGFAVGFNKYVAKFDRETLLNAINQTLIEDRRSY